MDPRVRAFVFRTVLVLSAFGLAACGGSGDDNGSKPDGQGGSGGTGIDFPNNPNTGGSAGDGTCTTDCEPEVVCGDAQVGGEEACDDGNGRPGDGCDGTCKVEPNWSCPTPGEACEYTPSESVCGNSVREGTEACDLGDGNDGTRGCTPTCTVVPGWVCPSNGGPCVQETECGDGVVQPIGGEQCDDGTNDGQHGCATDCTVITGWKCPRAGGPCTPDTYCGNGKKDGEEQCDDHNRRSYDGCSATCFKEAGWNCPDAGACARICGNSALDTGETCDDGNFYAGDGCSTSCQKEPRYRCDVVGSPCIYEPPPPPPKCGNGVLESGENCEDGNARPGDGCSVLCKVEPGWLCQTVGQACTSICGDGVRAGLEQCDDANRTSGDGCAADCKKEANAECPFSGGACVPMVCGDRKVTGTETCDDGVNNGQRGCSNTCQIITGWRCPFPGKPCVTDCGDGRILGNEQCDEGGASDCCSADCKVNPGWVCDPSKTPHSQPAGTYCGDGIVDSPATPVTSGSVRGTEQCDDGNKLPFDGCSPTCTTEPRCGTYNPYVTNPAEQTYRCFARCGDGIVLPPEVCDDGNALNGDGCDNTCKVELIPNTNTPAWECKQLPPGNILSLPVVWRDFSPRSHPQFSIDPQVNRRLPGIAQNNLARVTVGAGQYKYVPAYNNNFASPNSGDFANRVHWTMNGPGWVAGQEGSRRPPWMANDPAWEARVWWASDAATLTGTTGLTSPAGRFAQWYVDDPTVNRTYTSTLDMRQTTPGTYQYSCDGTACDSAFPGNPTGFFPLDDRGWVATNPVSESERGPGGHNYSFTTETRYWFVYTGGEQLNFYGDDDLWVFVNGQLALDIGGIHSKLAGYFQLGPITTPAVPAGSARVCVENTPNQGLTANCSTVNLGLTVGQVYEIAVFNAEREINDSNFQLTLRGFNGSPSVCTPICGDNVIVGNEECDNGTANVDPTGDTYGKCTKQCRIGPYCGDVTVQTPPETCDNGLNLQDYLTSAPPAGSNWCSSVCQAPAYCGDGMKQEQYGEQCDAGAQNADGYNTPCQKNCQLGARCGDYGVQDEEGETCDDGPNNGTAASTCGANCKLKCGNGSVEAGEECDDGTGASGNGSSTSKCATDCQWKCGNGQLETGEVCDDGFNTGDYGTCTPLCTPAAYCGDGTHNNQYEACDEGDENSETAYGRDSCTLECLPGGFCGDGFVNGPEKCDDGVNSGMPGSCKADCSAYVPTQQCGDGTVQPPEQCDGGSACDPTCRYACGNGIPEPTRGEQCDNGVNDGSYGTCTPECKLANYCGDGTKGGPEQCDAGDANVPAGTAYGSGVCVEKTCRAAPFCGDGRIQSAFGEQCEGNDNCLNCRIKDVE